MSSRLFKIVALFFFCISTKSIAADISGQVTTAEGQPVCALVLASGRSMFSCNPIGQFSLAGLPLEPDGSVNLQVYAEGFYPYLRNITQFGPQPGVIMPRAGSCPVDDGLSNNAPLDGTYRLIRASVIFNDSSGIDTANPASGVQATGTFVINGILASQRIDLTINGVPQTPLISNTTFIDYGFGLVEQNTGNPLILLERGNKLTTFVNGNVSGGPFAEVDQWAKVTSNVVSLESDISLQNYTKSKAPVGAVLSTMTEGHGLKLM